MRLEILETTGLYQICIYYKKLPGDYKAGTAVKLKLTPRMMINGSTHKITQDFFDVAGNRLSRGELSLQGKATIGGLYDRDDKGAVQ